MSDLMLLFHNPESFSDKDLQIVKRRIRIQKLLPYFTTSAAVLSAAYIDRMILKKASLSFSRLGGAAVFGLVIGGYFSY